MPKSTSLWIYTAHRPSAAPLVEYTSPDLCVVCAGIAAGAANEAGDCPLRNPFGDRRSHTEVGVVGVGGNDQRPVRT